MKNYPILLGIVGGIIMGLAAVVDKPTEHPWLCAAGMTCAICLLVVLILLNWDQWRNK